MKKYKFTAVRANQAEGHDVFSFAASPTDVLNFSEIERVGRQEDGQLKGFQRHQISGHIKEIRDYLKRDDALLLADKLVLQQGVRLVEGRRGQGEPEAVGI